MLDPSGSKRIEQIETLLNELFRQNVAILEAVDRIEANQRLIADMLQEIVEEEGGNGPMGG